MYHVIVRLVLKYKKTVVTSEEEIESIIRLMPNGDRRDGVSIMRDFYNLGIVAALEILKFR